MGKNVSSFQFRSGDPWNSEFTQRLEAVRSQTAKNTPGLRHVGLKIKQTPQGWTALVDPSFIRSIREIHAFQLVPMQDNGTWGVKVRFGTVNNEVPEIGGVPLNQDFESAPFLPVDVSTDGQRVVYLRIQISGTTFLITSLDILSAESLPADTETLAHVRLNSVIIASERITGIATPQVRAPLNYAYAGDEEHRLWRAA